MKLRFHSQTAGVSLTARRAYNTSFAPRCRRVGGSRRHQLAPHQFARRGACAADRDAATLAFERSRFSPTRAASRTSSMRSAGHFRRAVDARAEEQTLAYFHQIDRGRDGRGDRTRLSQREIAESSYRFQREVERKERIIVGVNDFVQEDDRRSKSCTLTRARPSDSSAARGAETDAR